MSDCQCVNMYENSDLRKSLGETLRPGGLELTKRAVGFTSLKKDSSVLDIGSGIGDTVDFLSKEYDMKAYGLEPSRILIAESLKKYPDIKVQCGKGECIPEKDGIFDGVFAECTLSLVDDIDAVLHEAFRVLKKGGCFVITDVYARNKEHLEELQSLKVKSCLRGMLDLDEIKNKLERAGFEINVCEDQTECLKQLTVKLIFEYGSMGLFWSRMMSGSGCAADSEKLKELLSRCKAGYFLLVCDKK